MQEASVGLPGMPFVNRPNEAKKMVTDLFGQEKMTSSDGLSASYPGGYLRDLPRLKGENDGKMDN